jgi:ABC-type proline/glycine betaine transport system permease subunit
VPTILLALVADRFFVWLEARVTPWAQRARPLVGAAT